MLNGIDKLKYKKIMHNLIPACIIFQQFYIIKCLEEVTLLHPKSRFFPRGNHDMVEQIHDHIKIYDKNEMIVVELRKDSCVNYCIFFLYFS